jgi:SAM-dependent methyltransferase
MSEQINNTSQVVRGCPACHSHIKKSVGEKNGYQILSCRRCKTLYVTNKGNIPESYDYADYYEGRDISTPAFVAKRLDEIVTTFESVKQKNRLLDIGCGSGAMLEAAQRKNWQAEGVEVSDSAVVYLRGKGFKVFHGFLHEANYPDNYFDVVTAVELFEHLLAPSEVIEEAARILRPGGILWATTPHSKGASARLLGTHWSIICPPEHVQLFSAKGLRMLLQQSGFSQINISTLGVNPVEILHNMRTKKTKTDDSQTDEDTFNRNETAFQLNSYFSEKKSRRMIKDALNGFLNLTRLGDSLKIWAQK